MRSIPLVILASFALSLFVIHKACEQEAQLDRIENAAGSCNVSVDACPPADVEPAAPSPVRVAICETGADALRVGDVTINAARSCERKVPNPRGYRDVLLGPASLADETSCNAWAAGAECPDSQDCRNASTPAQYLCRCRGGGSSGRTINGLHMDFRGIDASGCPPQIHNGCAFVLTMTNAQWHVLRSVALDTTGDYPAGLRALIDAMRDDPYRAGRRADVPACLRPSVPVRMGRSDIIGPVDVDAGAP